MDFVTISTAGVLLAILMAWYALLEYEERRQRKDGERSKHIPEPSKRKANRERRQDAGAYVIQQFGRSNGGRPPAAGEISLPVPSGQHFVFQGRMYNYGLAIVSVLLAYLFVTLGNLLFSFPPLIFFGASVSLTFSFGGRTAGLFALVLATLLSDFFFIKPTFIFSLDWQVFRLSVLYLLGGLLSLFISKRLTSPTRAN